MRLYFLRRLAIIFPTLFGISLICFFLVQLTPGGPVEQTIMAWRKGGVDIEGSSGRTSEITEEQKQALLEYYGFDKPIYTRYFLWIKKLIQFDFGESYYYNEPVSSLIKRALPVSITFGVFSFILTYVVCIPLGILKAVRHATWFDSFSSVIIFFLYSIPPFAFGVLLIVLFCGGSFWKVFPIEGLTSDNFSELSFSQKIADYFSHVTLPLICYTMGSFATLTMIMKNSLMDQMRLDYITTARSKGLSERRIVLVHALKNALLPIANGLGQWMTLFFSGSLLIETIFNLGGVGRLSYEAILHRDYPVVLTNIMILSALHIVGNLFSDILYVLLDPRIDFQQ